MNAERIIDVVGGLLVAAVLALMAVHAVNDPLAKDRAWLAEQLQEGGLKAAEEARGDQDFAAWQEAIAAHPELWRALSEPPKAPEAAPPPPCKSPSEGELQAKVKEAGIRFTRAQIGKKVKVVVGDAKRGDFYSEGDVVKEYTIKSFDRTSVVLLYHFQCPDKEKRDIEFSVDRE